MKKPPIKDPGQLQIEAVPEKPSGGPPIPRILLSAREMSVATGLSYTTIKALLRAEGPEQIRSFKIRGRRVIPASECVDLIVRMLAHENDCKN